MLWAMLDPMLRGLMLLALYALSARLATGTM